MSRADFWCRVLGWAQLAGGLLFAVLVLLLWEFILDIFMIDDIPALSFLVWIFVLVTALPHFVSGLLTVVYANAVEQAGQGMRGQQRIVLRLLMALAGLASAGVIGFAGMSVPPLTLFSLLGLATAVIAIMGPDWTADLLTPKDQTA
jgi:hypothetical protein